MRSCAFCGDALAFDDNNGGIWIVLAFTEDVVDAGWEDAESPRSRKGGGGGKGVSARECVRGG